MQLNEYDQSYCEHEDLVELNLNEVECNICGKKMEKMEIWEFFHSYEPQRENY